VYCCPSPITCIKRVISENRRTVTCQIEERESRILWVLKIALGVYVILFYVRIERKSSPSWSSSSQLVVNGRLSVHNVILLGSSGARIREPSRAMLPPACPLRLTKGSDKALVID